MSISEKGTRIFSAERYAGNPVMLLVVLAFIGGCTVREDVDVPFHQYLEGPPEIRVLIDEGQSRISLYAPAGTRVQSGGKSTLCSADHTMVVSARKSRAWIGDRNTGLANITFFPPETQHIQVNGRPYSGTTRITAVEDALMVINTVSVEDYVAGVVAGEMPLNWNSEALAAQAVAARSYVLNEKQKWAQKRPFDVYADERSQMYVGVPSNPKALKAASETRGTILVWNWKLFSTFYHSSCAGSTKNAYPFFMDKSLPPLSGVLCGYCGNVDTAWRRPVTQAELQKCLNLQKPVTAIEIADTPKGRRVSVSSEGGTGAEYSTNEFRELVGPRIIRSPEFTVRKNGEVWNFEGRGFGHGVGMCQHGANGMAQKGFRWPAIVRHYYPGARMLRVY